MKTRVLPGINIQTPWAELLLTGQKRIETRTYAMPQKYEGIELAVIETPGSKRLFKARIIGTIVFGTSYEYRSRASFAADFKQHLVGPDEKIFGWPTVGSKWAWPVLAYIRYEDHFPAPQPRGIVFASECRIPKLPQAASSSAEGLTTTSRIRDLISESNP